MNFWDFNVLFIFLIHWHLINTYKLSNYREQHLNFFSLLNATRFQTRVIGGVDCQYGERPFQCGLVDERVFPYGHFGGCVIIGHRVVLTAAHCAELADPLWTKVVYNRITQLVSAIEANNACDVIEVETIIIHPKYNRYTLDYDIAILVLKDRMRFNRFQASAIELIEPNIILPPGTIVELSGWGVIETRPHLKTPIILQKVKLPIVATNKCREIYNNSENSLYTITDRMICAGGLPDGGKDSCVGDSGGPLTYECDGRTILAGITSKGSNECGDPNIPGVYTRVSSFTKWTKRHLRKYEEEDIHYVVN